MKSMCIAIALTLVLIAGPVAAGVVFEVETTYHSGSPSTSPRGGMNIPIIESVTESMSDSASKAGSAGKTTPVREITKAVVEGRNLKIGGDMIYRGDRREMVVIDHDDMTYSVMNYQTMQGLADQANGFMPHMNEVLKNVPADQRAMFEQMMKQRMPKQRAPIQRSSNKVRKTGERARKAGYPSVKYEVVRDGRVIRELWVTDWENVKGGDEAKDTFNDMADFFHEMMESIPNMGGGRGGPGFDDNIFAHMKEIGGFPVVTRDFDEDGSLEEETNLRSARRQRLDPAAFEPPSGYKRMSMGPR